MNVTIRFNSNPGVNYVGWRCKWTAEAGGNDNPPGMPAVTPSQYNGQKFGTSVLFTEPLQKLSYAVMSYFNPTITRLQWHNIHKGSVALTNYQGFDMTDKEGNPLPPRADFVSVRDTDAELPKLMDGIVFSGSFVRGTVRDGHLWVKPGIGAIDANGPLPSVATIVKMNWYLYCVNNTRTPSHFAQGQYGNPPVVVIPYILSEEVPYTLSHFDVWNAATLPNPLQYYS